MPQGDRAAVYVDFLRIEASLPDDGQRLYAEGFVQFDQADVVQREARDFEGFGNSHYRSDAHNLRRHAAGGEAHKAGHGLQAQLARLAVGHDDSDRRAIAGLGRVARGDRAGGVEDRLELGERFDSGVGARPFVLGEEGFGDFGFPAVGSDPIDFEGHDLLVEPAFGLRVQGVLMAAVGESVGGIARDVVFALHALGGEPHVHVDFGAMVDEPRAGGDLVAAAGHQAHASRAARNDNVRAAGTDAVGGHGDGLQAGTAEAVDGHAGDGVRKAGAEGHATGHVVARFGFRHGATEDDVFDLGGGNLRMLFQKAADDRAREIVRARSA